MIVVPLFFFGRTALAALPGKTPGLCGECLEKTELRGGVSGIIKYDFLGIYIYNANTGLITPPPRR